VRKLYILFFALIIGTSILPAYTSAASEVRVELNGKLMSFKNPPLIKNGSVMLPFKELFNAMGLLISYDAKKQIIYGSQTVGNYNKVKLIIGNTQAYINDKPVTIPVAPFVTNNTSYVPLKIVGEATGAMVSWDGATRIVKVVENPELLSERLCNLGDLEGVQQVLSANPYLDLDRKSGVYLFNAMLTGKNLDVVKALVSAGANINILFSIDKTPLMVAVRLRTEWLQWFLDNGADLRVTNKAGETALDVVPVIASEEKKVADILSKALEKEVYNNGNSDNSIVQVAQLPHEIHLSKSNFQMTIESFDKNEMGYIVRVKYVNNRLEKNMLTAKLELKADDTELKLIRSYKKSGDETFGKGSAIYEYIYEKVETTPKSFILVVRDGILFKPLTIGLDSKKMSDVPLSFELLQPHLKNKYAKVLTDSGVAEFSINVVSWIRDTYRIQVSYDSSFFWNKEVMTEVVQQQLRSHMMQIAKDAIEMFPEISFEGTYHHSWYKYPNLRMDIQTSNHMTWDTKGSGQVPGMPYSFQWKPQLDDTLHLF